MLCLEKYSSGIELVYVCVFYRANYFFSFDLNTRNFKYHLNPMINKHFEIQRCIDYNGYVAYRKAGFKHVILNLLHQK